MSTDDYKPLYTKKLYSPTDWHISYVANDEQFKTDVESVKTEQMSKKELADKWGISDEVVLHFMLPLYFEKRQKTTSSSFDPWTGEGTINFTRDTTRAEILDEWAPFENFQQKVWQIPKTKRKPPAYPQLLYSTFKARKRGETFPAIFKSYKSGKLMGYSGETSMFDISKELEDYYHQYYPKNIPLV